MIFALFITLCVILGLFSLFVVIVPEQEAYIIERLGKYHRTLMPGLNFIIPILEMIRYRHSLKEKIINVPSQVCITQDNVSVIVDGVLYMSIFDPVKASYAIDRYELAAEALSQTTMRAEIGKIELDRSFSERNELNRNIIVRLDEITEAWGVKVTRYEILNIIPPDSVIDSMEKQVYAERKKRAEILLSEGQREAQINLAEGERESAINFSEGKKISLINEAEGHAQATQLLADATNEGNTQISQVLNSVHADQALTLSIFSTYLESLGSILKNSEISILPADLANLKSLVDILNLNKIEK